VSDHALHLAIRPIALAKPDAAAALGMSVDSFERYAQPHLRCIRRGRLRLYPVAELERWANDNAELTLPEHQTTSEDTA
jgi:hypothetical protein